MCILNSGGQKIPKRLGVLETDMSKKNGKRLLAIASTLSLLVIAHVSMAATSTRTDPAAPKNQPLSMSEQVRHELAMLPRLNVFDNLSFSIKDSNTVVLSGEVVRPILKSDAEAAVKHIAGVSKVINNIEVLPLSPFDDAIRVRTYRAIFSIPGFEKYAVQAVSPIRIIVKNGNITLAGFIGSRLEKTEADMATRLIPGVFSVTDDLAIG